MVKKSHSPEQIINKLREAEILLNQGANVGEAATQIPLNFSEILHGFNP